MFPRTLKNKGLRLVVLVGVVLAAQTANCADRVASAEDAPLSEAEKLLWMTDHLKNIGPNAKLKYTFAKVGTLEDGFNDTVELKVIGVNEDASKNVAIDFFSGDRHLPLEPRERVTGNQVLSVYLDGDLHEMHRLAKGSRPYFQRRLKLAFAQAAKIENVSLEFAGKKVAGKKIVVTPYINDPKRSMFEKFANKIYEFTVSDDIPGALYRIHTIVPDTGSNKAQAKPLIEESLTLVEASAGR